MPSSTRTIVSIAESTSNRGREADKVTCCCCMAWQAVVAISILTFLLGGALFLVGLFLNQETRQWQVQTVDLLGWLCMWFGGFLAILSLLGICSSRSGSVPLLFSYFVLLLLLLAAMLLSCLYAYMENDRVNAYIADNWDAIQNRLGFGDYIGGEDERLTLEEAIELLRTYFFVLGGLGVTTACVLATAFVATMRMLGIRAIATSLLLTLGVLGIGEAAVAYETLGQVPRATSYLLFGCAGTQALASITGACGFHWLNRECLCTSVSILSLAIFALAYVTGATYLWLRDTNPAHPGHLFLVFGISAVADFFMFCTLIFVLILYRRLLTDFRESESAHEMREEYSDYATRDRPASGRSGSKRRGSGSRRPRPREYLPSDSL